MNMFELTKEREWDSLENGWPHMELEFSAPTKGCNELGTHWETGAILGSTYNLVFADLRLNKPSSEGPIPYHRCFMQLVEQILLC